MEHCKYFGVDRKIFAGDLHMECNVVFFKKNRALFQHFCLEHMNERGCCLLRCEEREMGEQRFLMESQSDA